MMMMLMMIFAMEWSYVLCKKRQSICTHTFPRCHCRLQAKHSETLLNKEVKQSAEQLGVPYVDSTFGDTLRPN